MRSLLPLFLLLSAFSSSMTIADEGKDAEIVRVFIFAGQSNMEGADSRIADISRFPPFAGLQEPQDDVLFWWCIGREDKDRSEGWEALQSVRNMVGPELSFARRIRQSTNDRIAIIKVAAGGTHLGGDWNPDEPQGFEMYPLALQNIREALANLKSMGLAYRLEAFMWHQGENDMFNADYMANYGANLKRFLECWRRDLDAPALPFYIGELCTKTIWGMDLRPRMYAISLGQKQVTENDPQATYVPTSHVGVEIGGGVGLHYHYGTLGQLQHGLNYAEAWLASQGLLQKPERTFSAWPLAKDQPVRLFILAGHRNMEGERAFVQNLQSSERDRELLNPVSSIPFRYSLGGGVVRSADWEPLGPAGHYDNFGPELSFARQLRQDGITNFCIAKFTHSGSQIIDWTPEGSEAVSRNLYPAFLQFIRESVASLEQRGHKVQLEAICYHVGENDTAWMPFRRAAAERTAALIDAVRQDLQLPDLRWFVSQQPPVDDERLRDFDVVEEFRSRFADSTVTRHLYLNTLPPQEKQLVLDERAVIHLGEVLALACIVSTTADTAPEK